MKRSKSWQALCRAYTTSSRNVNPLQPIEDEGHKTDLGFTQIARLWIVNYNEPKKIYKSLRGILDNRYIWYASYIKIRSSKGSNTPGYDLNTLDGTTREMIDALREKVVNFVSIKRVDIPKGNDKTLGIPTLRDRLVQEVLRTILEPIFEPTFSSRSHGFRPGRSCHTALKYVNTQFKAVSWIIEGDISKYFDTINHNIMIQLLKRKIRDNHILDLIREGLVAEIFFDGKLHEHTRNPPGGILSPLLSNIYLDELDKFIDNIEGEYLGVRSRARYSKLMDKRGSNLLRWNPKLARKLRVNKTNPFDPEYRHIRYVRYADDFLIGVAGPYTLAIQIRDRIRKFLQEKLSLELNMDKTHITSPSARVPFLGYLIGRGHLLTKQRYGTNKKWVTRKVIIPTLDGNVTKMITSLAKEGFCDKSGNAKPNFSLLMLPQSEINARINAILRGLSNWWSIAGNRRQVLARISYILRFSIAKLYAAKFKLDTMAKVFKRAGKDLSLPLSKSKRSVVGVTDEWVANWFTSDVESASKQTKKRDIPPVLFCKYKDIPKPVNNKLKPEWNPKHMKPKTYKTTWRG